LDTNIGLNAIVSKLNEQVFSPTRTFILKSVTANEISKFRAIIQSVSRIDSSMRYRSLLFAMKSSENPGNPPPNKRPPILIALFALLVAGLSAAAVMAVLAEFSIFRPSPLPILTGTGILAAYIGFRLNLARWWLPILLLLPLALAASLYLAVPPWVYLLCFLALLVIYWNAAGERVPLYLSNTKTCSAINGLVPDHAKTFIDLGCGVGGVLLHLSRQRPDLAATGLETAPIPYLISKLRSKLPGSRSLDIRFASIWDENLGEYDAVYAFLSPEPMARLYRKVVAEMRPGSVFISNSFAVDGATPDEIIELDDSRKTRLLIWRR
jgi:hypothetical protein